MLCGRGDGCFLLGDVHVLVEVLGDVAHVLLDLINHMRFIHHMELSVGETRAQTWRYQRYSSSIKKDQRHSSNRDARDTAQT